MAKQIKNSHTQPERAKDFMSGQFPAGSMGPKILAAMDFIHGGKEVIITSIENHPGNRGQGGHENLRLELLIKIS